MNPYIALFRGINVGGNNILRMQDLRTLLEDLGAQKVKTYIQSGNAVFQHQNENSLELSSKIKAAIKDSHGFEPKVLLLSLAELAQAIAANPYSQAEPEPKTLTEVPSNPDLALLNSLKKDAEAFTLTDKVFYLYAPDGIGRSKLAERVERTLRVATTARSWRTVGKVMALAEEIWPY